MATQSFWQDRPVLVTGATGLLGGWLSEALVDLGAQVVVLVRDRTPQCLLVRNGLLERTSVVTGSLEDFDVLRRTVAEYSIDTVFHLAAQTIVGTAKKDPMGALEANVRGTWNILEACRQAEVKQVLVASSDKAYGASPDLPYRESTPLQGRYPYDVSKSCADLISTMYAVTYALPVSIVRCANLFGGGDMNFSRMIPDLIRTTLRGRPFVIRSDGKFCRDFLYVKDAVEAYLCLAEALAANRAFAGEAFNFGLEQRTEILGLVRKILTAMDRPDLHPVILNNSSCEIREQYLNCDRAHRQLNWWPAYSLEDGLAETIAWYRKYFTEYSGVTASAEARAYA
jgi:CDP-glucose 4,6-dehydratase